ncbi:MAG: DUF4383 domain-containing protein [Bacteriovoracia bacterium]
MATVMNPHQPHHLTTPRTIAQKVCIGLGIFFVIVGLGGIVFPAMFGMHLSLVHNVIHLVSGALALWAGYSDDFKRAYNFCLAFGVIYGLLGLAGFIFGNPGYPDVGNMQADENLLVIIPNALELGTMDHSFHIILSAIFLLTAYAWKKRNDVAGRTVVSHQARADFPKSRRGTQEVFRSDSEDLRNSESNLKDSSLGRSDINRRSDSGRRTDFERRV